MFFDKFLKPLVNTFSGDPLKSKNPETRKKAVQNLPVSDQQTLNTIALNDTKMPFALLPPIKSVIWIVCKLL